MVFILDAEGATSIHAPAFGGRGEALSIRNESGGGLERILHVFALKALPLADADALALGKKNTVDAALVKAGIDQTPILFEKTEGTALGIKETCIDRGQRGGMLHHPLDATRLAVPKAQTMLTQIDAGETQRDLAPMALALEEDTSHLNPLVKALPPSAFQHDQWAFVANPRKVTLF
jgi:hypothetical protein